MATIASDRWARQIEPGIDGVELIVPGAHCAGCIGKIERGLAKVPGIEQARLNLTTKRLSARWQSGMMDTGRLVEAMKGLGFDTRPFDPQASVSEDLEERRLLRALAIAGFAAANVMLLSVSVWSGAEDSTRQLFHWISALIALPAVLIAGQPFFASAWQALRVRTLNMDVPISLAVILASGMSLFETIHGGEHAYFDAAVMLLFFLLIGRYLDRRMRGIARSSATRLMALTASGATVIETDGREQQLPLREIEAGMRVLVRPGERVPVDGTVLDGVSDIDRALVTGETVPERAAPGAKVHAGTDNLTGVLTLKVSAVGEGTLLAEIVRLVEAAERGKGAYVRIADRAAQIYAPAVHLLALFTFLGWLWIAGDWHFALITAIATLIITCPCALGLAVPAVQVVAAGRLMRRGIMMKDGSALEKLAEIDTAAFDKTGTLTEGTPRLIDASTVSEKTLALAAGLARGSRHPLAKALRQAAETHGVEPLAVDELREVPGAGLEGRVDGQQVQLGRAGFVGASHRDDATTGPETWLFDEVGQHHRFQFEDRLRDDASDVVRQLRTNGLQAVLLSGDRPAAVEALAKRAGIEDARGSLTPAEKLEILSDAAERGQHVLMVGDGLNDTPALAAAHVSMSPASAADISRNAASFVYLGEHLAPVSEAWITAKRARRLILQNFALAATYNAIAIPIAVMGYASPLVAAVAMSTSSILVTGNALRLGWSGPTMPKATSSKPAPAGQEAIA